MLQGVVCLSHPLRPGNVNLFADLTRLSGWRELLIATAIDKINPTLLVQIHYAAQCSVACRIIYILRNDSISKSNVSRYYTVSRSTTNPLGCFASRDRMCGSAVTA